jgi:histidine triad (HIT) family protein
MSCPFCDIAEDPHRLGFIEIGHGVMGFPPLNPVTEGHLLIAPMKHVPDAAFDPSVTAVVMEGAARVARGYRGDCNIITSIGPAATQTVFHLHVHIVPRREGDGLKLPWSDQ